MSNSRVSIHVPIGHTGRMPAGSVKVAPAKPPVANKLPGVPLPIMPAAPGLDPKMPPTTMGERKPSCKRCGNKDRRLTNQHMCLSCPHGRATGFKHCRLDGKPLVRGRTSCPLDMHQGEDGYVRWAFSLPLPMPMAMLTIDSWERHGRPCGLLAWIPTPWRLRWRGRPWPKRLLTSGWLGVWWLAPLTPRPKPSPECGCIDAVKTWTEKARVWGRLRAAAAIVARRRSWG